MPDRIPPRWRAAGPALHRRVPPDYAAVLAEHAGRDEPHLSVAVSPSLVANRVSYALGLRGPSVTVDTLCSSSLVAVAQAIAALRAANATRPSRAA
ncbi:hypothetical protein EQG64_34285 [Streptomyces sp. S6]|nr:hypothetical protein EQG64_34285 [Streptomyces sp. S6]